MTDEQQPVVETPVEGTPVETPPAPEQAHVETPVPISWQDELAKLDPKEFRKVLNQHDKLSGVVGYMMQQERQAERARIDTESKAEAERKAVERLREQARTDPVSFADTWLSEEQQKDVQRQLDNLRGNTRQEMATAIGRAFQDVPEWAETTVEDREALAKVFIGKTDDEVLPLFNKHALDLVAGKRAQKMFEKFKAEELAKEREALRTEEAAKLLKTSDGPDTTKPKGPGSGANIKTMTDAEFEVYYRQRFGR